MKTRSLYPFLVTENLEETLKFYTEVLDYSVKHNLERADGGHILVLQNEAGFQIEIMEESIGKGPKSDEFGLRMNVWDMDEAVAELKEKGCQVLGEPIKTRVGKNLLVKDPNGITITLVEHIYF